MRKQHSVVLLVFGLLIGLVSHAQPPGFLGRRTSIHLGISLMPAISSYKLYSWSGNRSPYLNHTESITLQLVTSRRSALGFTADISRVGYKTYFDSESGRSQAMALGFGITYKGFPFLKRGYIAPLGPYLTLGCRTMYIIEKFRPFASEILVPFQNTIGGSFTAGMGYSRIIADRILLDFGLRFSRSFVLDPGMIAEVIRISERAKLHFGLGILLGK